MNCQDKRLVELFEQEVIFVAMITPDRFCACARPISSAVRHVFSAAVLCVLISGMAPSQAADSAVVLIYHRFGEQAHPSTNVRLEQFERQVALLREGGYAVLPLAEIVSAIRSGTPLPDKAVAITIDDAYLSVYEEAWPRLKAAGFPFTLFVATDPVDRGVGGYMTWDQIRELRDAGAAIGSQTATHPHMAGADRASNLREIRVSNRRFVEELGTQPDLFAYPYGEASTEVMGLVAEAGFSAGFGQHSGAMDRHSPQFYLPRFPVNEVYGDVERFRRIANTLSIPIEGITPEDPLVGDVNPPPFGFSVVSEIPRLSELACYHSQVGEVAVQRLGALRFEIRFNKAFPTGRSRLNCTVPAKDGRWRWFGTQFYVPRR